MFNTSFRQFNIAVFYFLFLIGLFFLLLDKLQFFILTNKHIFSIIQDYSHYLSHIFLSASFFSLLLLTIRQYTKIGNRYIYLSIHFLLFVVSVLILNYLEFHIGEHHSGTFDFNMRDLFFDSLGIFFSYSYSLTFYQKYSIHNQVTQ